MNRQQRKRASKPSDAVDIASLYKELVSLRKELNQEPAHSVVKKGNMIRIPGSKIRSTMPSKIRYVTSNGEGATHLIILSIPENFELEAPFTRLEVTEGEIVYYHKQ